MLSLVILAVDAGFVGGFTERTVFSDTFNLCPVDTGTETDDG